MTSATIPEAQPMFSHSLKLEETAKGLRISVHIYAHNTVEALEEHSRLILTPKLRQLTTKYH